MSLDKTNKLLFIGLMAENRKKHILIVEDSPDLQHLLNQLFSKEGYTTSKAFDGQQALEWLRKTQDLPDLIFLDIMMPVMDGFEFRYQQMKDPRLAGIPVVVMTADSNSQLKAHNLGTEVIRKPILDIDVLLDVASRLMA